MRPSTCLVTALVSVLLLAAPVACTGETDDPGPGSGAPTAGGKADNPASLTPDAPGMTIDAGGADAADGAAAADLTLEDSAGDAALVDGPAAATPDALPGHMSPDAPPRPMSPTRPFFPRPLPRPR